MPGTVRKIIERIKDKRSGGNSVVALTVETRLVLQGFDPQRFDFDTPDDAGRLARIAEIADEMRVDVADLVGAADVEPDPEAAPAPPPQPQAGAVSEAARSAAASAAGPAPTPTPRIADDHPLRRFRQLADAILTEIDNGEDGANSGASFDVLVKSSALMALYSIHKDSVFCDLLRHDTLFQWFLGLTPDAVSFDATAFFNDREQALNTESSRRFFDRLIPAAGRDKLFSADAFQASSADFKSWMTPRGGLR